MLQTVCMICWSLKSQVAILLLLLLARFGRGQSNGDLRLNNDKELLSTEVTAGRLEIYLNSEWGTICDDNFHQVEASVACKQLGFSGVLSYGVTGSLGFENGNDDLHIHLDQVNCTGMEDAIHLLACKHNRNGDHDCFHTEDVAIICNSTLISEINPFIGQIRIVGGKYPSEGLVEVHCNGEWGTICDDAFGKDEADTVCIQMGYTDAVQYDHLASITGNESQAIWLDDVECAIGEVCITSCQRCPTAEQHNCLHTEDITVKCAYNTGLSRDEYVQITSCKYNSTSSISGEIIAVIVVSIIFGLICFSFGSVCVALAICWKKNNLRNTNFEDSVSNATEMTRSTASSQPVPPPRPSDLPPLATPTSTFSPTFSPFSPFDPSLPLPPPRPQNLGKITTPTKPLLSPFPALGIYEATPVYIAPGSSGRPIYVEPSKMDEMLPPPYPGFFPGNHYERTPTGNFPNDTSIDTSGHYESIPPVECNFPVEHVLEESQINQQSSACSQISQQSQQKDCSYDKLSHEPNHATNYDNLTLQANNGMDKISCDHCVLQSNVVISEDDKIKEENPNNSYVNINEIQVEDSPCSYDTLKALNEEAIEHCYEIPPSEVVMDDQEQKTKLQEDHLYENNSISKMTGIEPEDSDTRTCT